MRSPSLPDNNKAYQRHRYMMNMLGKGGKEFVLAAGCCWVGCSLLLSVLHCVCLSASSRKISLAVLVPSSYFTHSLFVDGEGGSI